MASPASKLVANASAIGNGDWPPGRDVVTSAQRGDLDAQRRLYDACRNHVFGLVYRMVGPDDADDAHQQVFLQVFRNLHQFAGESRFETWLFRLTINECLQLRRRRSNRSPAPLEEDPVDSRPDHERSTDERDLLDAALSRLEPDLRDVFVLREIQHLSYAEIGEALEISEGTVASRLNRARRRLQQVLAELGWEP